MFFFDYFFFNLLNCKKHLQFYAWTFFNMELKSPQISKNLNNISNIVWTTYQKILICSFSMIFIQFCSVFSLLFIVFNNPAFFLTRNFSFTFFRLDWDWIFWLWRTTKCRFVHIMVRLERKIILRRYSHKWQQRNLYFRGPTTRLSRFPNRVFAQHNSFYVQKKIWFLWWKWLRPWGIVVGYFGISVKH